MSCWTFCAWIPQRSLVYGQILLTGYFCISAGEKWIPHCQKYLVFWYKSNKSEEI